MGLCSVEGCASSVHCRGWCRKHYTRWRRHGNPLITHHRSDRGCRVSDCERPHHARDLCALHLRRLRDHGSVDDPRPDLNDRFWAKVEIGDDCWIWQGAQNDHGYGQIRIDGRPVYAHRYAYETLVGPIPEGLELDHLCCTPPCVNPNHLEPVTHGENMRRWREKVS